MIILYLTAYESDGVTVLTPPPGAVHSDNFKLASVQGQAGYQPYLDADSVIVRGGRFNPQTGASDVGEGTCAILDMRTSPANAERWLTAFGRLTGVRVQLAESTDGGATKTPIFTGRITRDALDDDRLIRRLAIRDQTGDLDADVFVAKAHASITYCSRPFLLPLGLQQAYGAIPATTMLAGIVTDQTDTRITIEGLAGTDRNVTSQFLIDIVNGQADNAGAGNVKTLNPGLVRAVLTNLSFPANSGHFEVVTLGGAIPGDRANAVTLDVLRDPVTGDILTSDPNYLNPALVLPGDQVRIGIIPYRLPVDYEAPFVLSDTTWPQLWKDLLDGKFGSLNDDGTVVRTWAYDAAAFTALIAEADAPVVRDIVAAPVKLFDYLVDGCRAHGYGWYVSPAGEFVPFRSDMPAEDVSAYPEIVGSVDTYATPAAEWDDELLDAATKISVIYFLDYERSVADWRMATGGESAAVPGGLLWSVEFESVDPFIADPSLPEKSIIVVDRFTRATKTQDGATGTVEGLTETEWARRRIEARVQQLAGMSRGTAQVTLPGRRTTITDALTPGDWVRVTVPELPDPQTGLRGGTRFMQVSQRDYDGLERPVRLVDFGIDTQSAPPVITNCQQETGNTFNGVECDVALNAAGDPVQLQIAVTAIGATVPAADDPAWTFALRIEVGVTDKAVRNLPSGKRIWFRARSEPDWVIGNLAVKSNWAAGNTHVDTAIIAAPGAFNATMGNVYATVAWTAPQSVYFAELLLDGVVVGRVVPGATSFLFEDLEPATSYVFSARYVDPWGGVGTAATDTDTTTAAPSLDEPFNLNALVEYPHTFDGGLVGAAFQLWFQSAPGWPTGAKVGVYVATEDGPGLGTYGAYVKSLGEVDGQVAPVSGDWTKAKDGTLYPEPGPGVSVSMFNGQYVYMYLDPDIKRKWYCRMETAGGVALSIDSAILTVDLTVASGIPPTPLEYLGGSGLADGPVFSVGGVLDSGFVLPAGDYTYSIDSRLLWSVDNDAGNTIGASGASRPYGVYVGTEVKIGAVTAVDIPSSTFQHQSGAFDHIGAAFRITRSVPTISLRSFNTGSAAVPAVATTAATFGTISGQGWDGVTGLYEQGGYLQFKPLTTWSGTSHPLTMDFAVTPRNSTSNHVLMRIGANAGDDNLSVNMIGLTGLPLACIQYTAATYGQFGFVRVNNTLVSPTSLVEPDVMGFIGAYGSDGTNHSVQAAEIVFNAMGTWAPGNTPSQIAFANTLDGATGFTATWIMGSGGNGWFGPLVVHSNLQDIGRAVATIRTIYIGTSVIAPLVVTPLIGTVSAVDTALQRNNTAIAVLAATGLNPGANDTYGLGVAGTGWQFLRIQHAADRGRGLELVQTLTGSATPRIMFENTTDFPGAGTSIKGGDASNRMTFATGATAGSGTGTPRWFYNATELRAVSDNAMALGLTGTRWSTIFGYTGDFTTRVTAPIFGTTTAVDTVLQRNSVAQLTLGSLVATFAGTAAMKETGGATLTLFGAVADGEFLKRSGTTIVGAAGGGGSGLSQAQVMARRI